MIFVKKDPSVGAPLLNYEPIEEGGTLRRLTLAARTTLAYLTLHAAIKRSAKLVLDGRWAASGCHRIIITARAILPFEAYRTQALSNACQQ